MMAASMFPAYQLEGKLVLDECMYIKGMEHVPNIFMSFDNHLFLKVINILI